MKKIRLTWFLLLLLLFQSSFMLLYYMAGRTICHIENSLTSIHKKPQKEILIFDFQKDNCIHWEIQNREFSFSGKMYDVVSIRDSSGHLLIKCIADAKETFIVGLFRNFKKHGNNSHKNLIEKLCLLYNIPNDNNMRSSLPDINTCKGYFSSKEPNKGFMRIINPPPETLI